MAFFYTEGNRKGSYQGSTEEFLVYHRISKITKTAITMSKSPILR